MMMKNTRSSTQKKFYQLLRRNSVSYSYKVFRSHLDYIHKESVGSPDSEVVEKYFEKFVYDPKRRDEVLAKYEKLYSI